MAEAQKDTPVFEVPVVKQPEQVKEPSPTELNARNQGWVPKEEWTGDPEEWVSAREFVRAGELFKKIDDQNRTIKGFKKDLEELGKHHAEVKKVEYQRALEDLKAKKKTALLEGDADAVIDIDERLSLVREAVKEQPVPQPKVDVDPQLNVIFNNWVQRNNWYKDNKAMRAYADKLGTELHGNMSPTDVLAQIEREVRKEFADRFTNPNRNKPGAVEGSSNNGGKVKDTFTLTDDERRAMNKFIKIIPGFTEEKYISELKARKGE